LEFVEAAIVHADLARRPALPRRTSTEPPGAAASAHRFVDENGASAREYAIVDERYIDAAPPELVATRLQRSGPALSRTSNAMSSRSARRRRVRRHRGLARAFSASSRLRAGSSHAPA
jgi:hypothetical protein